MHERKIGTQNEQEKKIGKIIADNLVDNGATLQMGKQINILNKSGKSEFRKKKNKFVIRIVFFVISKSEFRKSLISNFHMILTDLLYTNFYC